MRKNSSQLPKYLLNQVYPIKVINISKVLGNIDDAHTHEGGICSFGNSRFYQFDDKT